uniref:ShKT domain-containing protein n=1 Tax=Panagrellus redivivus TaxID=6233 RepID=A0A7E5A1U3_PANRE
MFRLTSTFLLIGTIVAVSAYPPGYVPQRCQDDDGHLLPSATDCEDESDLCPSLFGNITTDVRAKACNSEIDVVKEGVMMCAKTCKVCCEKPKPPTPEPVTPGPYPLRSTESAASESTTIDEWWKTDDVPPLRCQDENGTLLPSATDCEDEYAYCSEIFFESDPTVVRPYRCDDEVYADNYTLSCAKTCKVCCEQPKPSNPEPVTTDLSTSESTTTDYWWINKPEPLRCQDENGWLLPSATDCEDEIPECESIYNKVSPFWGEYVRSAQCNDKNFSPDGDLRCAKTCKVCCERENATLPALDFTPDEPSYPWWDLDLMKELFFKAVDIKPHCQYENGTLMESATNCEDKIPDACQDLFTIGALGTDRSPNCYKKELRYFALMWCPKSCGMCCEVTYNYEKH